MSGSKHVHVLVQAPGGKEGLRSCRTLKLLRGPDMGVAQREANIIVMVAASALPEVGAFVREANKRHHLKALLVDADVDERWIGQLLDRARVRALRNLLVHKGNELPARILDAWRSGAQDKLIADAVALPDRLLVVSCALERIEVPYFRVQSLKQMAEEERARFEVDRNGAHLYWPDADVHLDLDSMRIAVDERTRGRAQLDAVRKSRGVGAAIAELRRRSGLAAAGIRGLSDRQVRRIEQGLCLPRTGTFEKLAVAHGMTLSEYLDSLASCPT